MSLLEELSMKPDTESKYPTYICAVFFVKDIEVSKEFYSCLLGQKIMMDHGANVVFEGGLAIWDGDYALNIMNLKKTDENEKPFSHNNSEIYFESSDLNSLYEKIQKEKIEFIHPIKEQPWGQRCFRVYDPDGHIVEFGEPMSSVIIRYAEQGMTPEEIGKRTTMPLDVIKEVLGR